MDLVQWFAVPSEQAALVAVSVGLAALIRAFTGFGFAMLVVPAFSFFLMPGDWASESSGTSSVTLTLRGDYSGGSSTTGSGVS